MLPSLPDSPLEIPEQVKLDRLRLASQSASRRFRIGALVSVIAAVILMISGEVSTWDAVGVTAFYLFFPALAIAQLPLLRHVDFERVPIYLQSMVAILGVGILALLFSWVSPVSGSWIAPGLALVSAMPFASWTIGTLLAVIGLIAIFAPLDRRFEGERTRWLDQLLPSTARERRVFVGLSVAAGIGEELAYRGYALAAIQLVFPGVWMAAAISSVAFGFLHAYQGPIGMVRTAAMGFVLAIPVVLGGSLLPSMLAHAMMDVLAGLVIGPRMISQKPFG